MYFVATVSASFHSLSSRTFMKRLPYDLAHSPFHVHIYFMLGLSRCQRVNWLPCCISVVTRHNSNNFALSSRQTVGTWMRTGININTLWSMGVDTGTDSTKWEQGVRQRSDISRWKRESPMTKNEDEI